MRLKDVKAALENLDLIIQGILSSFGHVPLRCLCEDSIHMEVSSWIYTSRTVRNQNWRYELGDMNISSYSPGWESIEKRKGLRT